MEDLIIRSPHFNEIYELLVISSQAFDRPVPPTIKNQENLLIALIKNDIANFIIVEQNNRILGLGAAFFFRKVCSLGYMSVLKEFRNRGIGTKIFNSLMDDAITKGCETFFLYASNLGEPIYKKLGFQGRFYETMYNLQQTLDSKPISNKKVKIGSCFPKWAKKLDIEAIGFDRYHYLDLMINHGSKLLLVENEGYGLITDTRLGPLIVKDLDSAIYIIREAISQGADHIIIPHHHKLPQELFYKIKLTEKTSNNNIMMIKGKDLNMKLEYFFALGTYAKG
jgi:GNAT superfamily N-acetyltransferase